MDWVVWLGAAVLLAILEMFSLDLIFLMLAAGCLAATIVAVPFDSWILEAIVALVVSISGLGVIRPPLLARLHRGPELRLGPDRLVGLQAQTEGTISAGHPGQLIIGGEQWTAEPYDSTLVIEPGTTVEVLLIKGAIAYVHPMLKEI